MRGESLLYAIFSVSLVTSVVAEFKSIPGPPYGGDLYFHNGIAEAIFHGTPVFRDPTNYGGYAFYPWLYHLTVALFANVTGRVMPVTTYVMPVFLLALSMLVVHRLLREITTERVAAFAPLLVLALSFPDAHPNTLLRMVMVPLFYLLLFRFLREPTPGNGTLLGISWGLAGLTHVLGTFGIGAVLSANVIWDASKSRSIDALRKWVIPFAVALPILLLYWGPLLFAYHGHTPNPYQSLVCGHYTVIRFTADTATFFVFTSWKAVLSVMAVVGIYALLRTGGVTARVMLSSVLGMYAVGVLFILLGMPLIARKLGLYHFALNAMLISLGISFAMTRFPARRAGRVVWAIVLVALLGTAGYTVQEFRTSPWTMNGFHKFEYSGLQEWLLHNTDVNDVVLSSYESSFLIFSISGRKTVLFRRTHASPFVDYDRRSADIMVALYTPNASLALSILRRYHVKYVYVDSEALEDPLWVPVSYRDYLERNGVQCSVETVRYDPSDPNSVRIKACVANFNINNLRPYLKLVFSDGDSKLYLVVYPRD